MTSAALRYAKGLYIASEDQKLTQPVFNICAALSEALKGSQEVQSVLSNPLVKDAKKIKLMRDVLTSLKADKKALKLIENLTVVLGENRRLAFIGSVLDSFKQIVDEKEGRITAEVVTASVLTEVQRKEVQAFVKKECENATAVELTEKVDENLIAGLKIRMGSVEVDASTRGRLDRMKNSLGL